jgi:hypothetical protein
VQTRKFLATVAAVGACTIGGFSAASPAYATTTPAHGAAGVTGQLTTIGAPDIVRSHWIVINKYNVKDSCLAEGSYLIVHIPNYSAYQCFSNAEDLWVLEVLDTSQS